MRRSFIAAATTLLALASLVVSAVPVAAATVKGTGFHVIIADGSVRGVVIVDRTGGDQPRMNAGLVGLLPHMELNIVGRSIDCDGTPARRNRELRIRTAADANGDVFMTRELSVSFNYEEIKSLWVNARTQGEWSACANVVHFERLRRVGDRNGDGADGIESTGDGQILGNLLFALERRPANQALLGITFRGGDGNDDYSVRGVNAPCGEAPTSTHFTITFGDVIISAFRTETIGLTQDELDGLRSLRVRNISQGGSACVPLSIIGILIS